MESPWPVVAAIDFGTHGTGYAWIEVIPANRDAGRRLPHYRDTWPGSQRRRYPKNLSALLLDPAGAVAAWGHEAEQQWRELSVTGEHHGWTYVSDFKMALKSDAYRGTVPPGLGARRINTPKEAFPLVVEYLRRIYTMACEEIGLSGYLEDQIRWCLTVPAIWDDTEKQLMRDAAEAAGLPKDPDRLLLALEPEVAALHCQIHLARVLGSQQDTLDITADGRRFTVVDCGGGTVDITSYRVSKPAGDVRLDQIARASGGKLGSEYINEAFAERVLADRFGGAEAVAALREAVPHAFGDLIDAWENNKVTATAQPGPDGAPVFVKPLLLPIPGEIRDLLSGPVRERLARLPGGLSRLAVQPEECRQLFDSVVAHILELVEKQLHEVRAQDGERADGERLLLVGGLAESSYLQMRLQHHFAGRASLIVPAQPAGTVLFGAVHFGYDPSTIRSRLTRYTYGCEVSLPFRAGVDAESRRFRDHRGRDMCGERFSSFVRCGESVEAGTTVSHTYFPTHEEHRKIHFKFYRTVTPRPGYVDETGVEKIGDLVVELGTAMDLPVQQRVVEVGFAFGNTEIAVTAVNKHTGEQVHSALRFDSLY